MAYPLRKEGMPMDTFQVLTLMLAFGMFTISMIKIAQKK